MGMQRSKLIAGAAGVLVAAALVSAQTVYLLNGSFSQCAAPCEGDYPSPTEWGIEGMPSTMGIWRDAIDFHSAPAGLTVMSVGDSQGHFTQRLDTIPPRNSSFTYDLWVKVDSANGGSFQLVVHFSCHQFWGECMSGGSQVGWKTLYMGNAPTTGWTNVTGSSTVPDGAVWALFRIYNAGGNITFHVDDIKINGQEEVVSVGEPRLAPVASTNRASIADARMYTVTGKVVEANQPTAHGVRLMKTGTGVAAVVTPAVKVK
jgi:hypothetical protein